MKGNRPAKRSRKPHKRPARPKLQTPRPSSDKPVAEALAREWVNLKPLPDTPEAKGWDKSVSTTLGFLLRLGTTATPHGQKWRDGMRRYYLTQLVPLLTTPPPGAEDRASAYREFASTL